MLQGNERIISLPYRGAPSTVSVIRDAVLRSQEKYNVRQLAEDICCNLRSKDYLSEILAIYHYVCANTRYMRDPRTVELVRAPWVVADELTGGKKPNLDCDDMSVLISALCMSVGCQVRVVTVAFRNAFFNGERQYSHVFAQAHEPRSNTWITLDPVAKEQTAQMLNKSVAAKIWPLA